MKNKLFILLLVLLVFPVLANSAYFTTIGTTTFTGLIDLILNALWKIFAAFAVISFVIAGMFFLTAQGQPEKIETAKRFVLWGVVGIIVAILAYSVVNIVINLF